MSNYSIYTVVTSSTCITHYKVRAKSEEDAKDQVYSGEYWACKDVDFKNETIEEVNKQEARITDYLYREDK